MLSDRIVVLNPRPTSVREIIDVNLPRPRGTEVLSSPEFGELERRILEHLQRH